MNYTKSANNFGSLIKLTRFDWSLIDIMSINYKVVKSLLISLVIVLSLVNVWQYYQDVNKAPWKDAVAYVDLNAKSGDLLLFNSLDHKNIFEYYSNRTDLIYKSFPDDSCCINQKNIETLKPTINGYDRVWFIRNSPDNLNLVKEILNPSYNFSEFGSYSAKYDNGIIVYLLETIKK